MLFFFILHWTQAHAQDIQSIALIAGSAGGAAATANQAYLGMIPYEIEEWRGSSGTTSAINNDCGLILETRLIRGSRRNYLFLGLNNPTSNTYNIQFNKLEFEFGSGKVRFTDIPISENTYELKAGWYAWGFIPFPNKQDFKGEDSLVFKLPTHTQGSNCILQNKHMRNKHVSINTMSESNYTVFDMSLELGANINLMGKLNSAQRSANQGAGLLSLSGFGSINHGMHFLLYGSDLGKPESSYYDRPFATDTRASLFTFGLGYTYRTSLANNNHWVYLSPGLAYSGISFSNNKESKSKSSSYISTYFNVSYDYVFSSVSSGFWTGDHAIGITLVNNYIPSQQDRGISIEGASTGALLRYRLGY